MAKAFAKPHGLKHEGKSEYGPAEYGHLAHGARDTGPGGNMVTANGKEKFLQSAINPKHEGYCTPMSKATCTPRRKALARRLKPGGDLYKGGK